ncbi:MAG TPA: protease inhibitor I9 family protein, partial [Acidimicrobiales bacterium]
MLRRLASAPRLAGLAATLLVAGLLTAAPAPAAAGARQDVIVRLRTGTATSGATAADHAARYGAQVRYVYRHAVAGYAASVPVDRLAELRRDPAVASVERDGVVRATGARTAVPWNLDRIDQRYLP